MTVEMKHPDYIANSAEAPPPAEPARDFPDWRGAHKHELAALEKRVSELEKKMEVVMPHLDPD